MLHDKLNDVEVIIERGKNFPELEMLEQLKLHLLRRGITQRYIANAIGISEAHLSRIVHGEVRCRARLRRRIAEVLQVRANEVFPPKRGRRRT